MTPAAIEDLALSTLVYLADLSVRTSAFAALMAALAVAVRGAPAAVRLDVWRFVLVAALAMPLLGRALPGFPIEVPLLASAISAADGTAVGAIPPVGAPESAIVLATTASDAGRAAWITWPVLLFVVYLTGVVALLTRLATGARVARRFLRETRPIVDQRLLDRVRALSTRVGLSAAPPVHDSPEARVPISIAVAHPVVVLPGDWYLWSAVKLDAVLLHELSHVARRDPLTQRVSLVYRAANWFNPLSWWLHRRLVELGEHASDDAVLSGGVGAADYAETLVGFFVAGGKPPRRAAWHVSMAAGTAKSAVRRVERVLNWSRVSTTRVRSLAVATVLVTTVPTALVAATVTPAHQALPAVRPPQQEPAPAFARPTQMAALAWLTSPAVPAASGREPAATTPMPNERRPAVAIAPEDPPSPAPAIPEPLPQSAVSATAAAPEQTPMATMVSDEEFFKDLNLPDPNTLGLQPPQVLRAVRPSYTPEAMHAKVHGQFQLQCVVMPDGTVGRARVVRIGWTDAPPIEVDAQGQRMISELYGLDREAIRAASKWLFHPATINGQPVPFLATLDLSFRIF